MKSLKTKTNNYTLVKSKAIAGFVLIPVNGHFMGYVAWEWEDVAKQKFFAIIEAPYLIGNDTLTSETINWIADYGNDVTFDLEAQKLFPQLF